ncbi:MAG: SAM hydrolase/SAM-dependent halogenase family protein, partial [Acidimicrobiales bacterium]
MRSRLCGWGGPIGSGKTTSTATSPITTPRPASEPEAGGRGTRLDTVVFLSDYGLSDEFVGVVHRAIRRQAPHAAVIDLTHQVPRHDVKAGAALLWRAAPWLAPAVVLAVVDPGVGTQRRGVAVETGEGDRRLVFVGPDSGLLTAAALRAGSIRTAVVLDDPQWH